jgi:FkbM family methyltransferase
MTLIDEVTRRVHRAEQEVFVTCARESFADCGAATPCYVLGRNEDSSRLMSQLTNVLGVIDDFAGAEQKWCNVPVVSRNAVPFDALIINAVTNSKPRQAADSLKNGGFSKVHHMSLVADLVPEVSAPAFVTEFRKCFFETQARWQSLYDCFGDEVSRETLLDIMAYRLSGNPACLANYDFAPEKQYFEPFLAISNDVFVDGGGCKGETTLLFANLYPDYGRIEMFEPDIGNIREASSLAQTLARTRFHALGLSDSPGTLYFDAGRGSASSVSAAGDVAISVETLDNLVPDASFIKLDLEGWELPALKGAQKSLIKNKPKLAIGAYHRPVDFLEISDWVMSTNPSYKLALRHYTESWTESVLYFY